jgi:O-antigen ligase
MISDYPIIAMEMQIQGIATLIAGMGCFLTVNNINEAFRGVRLPLWGILFSVIGLLSILFSNIYTLRFSPNDVNPNAIGIFLAPCIALSLYVALWNSQKLYRFVALFLVFSLYLLIIATGSRNAAGTAMILSLILLTPLLRRPLIFFVTGLVLIGGLNLLLTNINLEGFSRLTDLDTIDHARMIFWKQRINNISNPFLGAGTAFSYNHAGELSWSNMHSIYVQIFYETGIIGLFLFAVSILFSLKKWFSLFGNVKHSMVWFAAALLATPLCIGLFESAPLFRLQMSTFFWGMGVALIDQLNRDEFYFGSHRT